MSLSLIIPSALFLLSITSAVPLTTPALTPDISPFPSPESPPELFTRAPSSCAPSGLFDLSVFTLQLPTGSAGNVDSISSTKLSGCDGWRSKDYFYMDGDALVMKVPGSHCVTTQNSQHCRTELRESSPRSWDPETPINSLKVELAVVKADNSKYGTVIGQVKVDGDVSTKPLAEVFYARDGTIRIGVSQVPNVSSLKMGEVGHVAVGTRFGYELKYQSGRLSIRIGGGREQFLDTGKIRSPKSYFKVGNYNQGDSTSEVRFYEIDVRHG
jgi:hypothetical protein